MVIPSLAEAQQIQAELRHRVILHNQFTPPQTIAGVDVAFPQKGRLSRAAIVVLSYPGLEVLETAVAEILTSFPYIPGYLSFRELPALLAAWHKLHQQADMILVDGQGLAHPRRFGLACHLGVVLDKPTIAVAKSRLVGLHDPVPLEKGQWVPLMDQQETIGAVLRSRVGVRPLYISQGHRLDLPTVLDYVKACLSRYRLPEPTRLADKLSKSYSA
ncbi:deoxyribonuclease V [Synechocystis sp. LKSZ1]|uniref:deoxyribonuclease V n=1 Tax=Synechocystis sp. LKSZ1 TaxID=3144951 RepID=UPI00336C215C